MKKRIVAILLFFVIFMGNVVAFANEGDIIHTGLKKIYKCESETDQEELLQDIIDNVDISKFYREINDGKYVNIVDEENEHFKNLKNILSKNNISNPDDIQKYVIDNAKEVKQELNQITQKIAIDFNSINDEKKGILEEYIGASSALMLNDKKHYSNPVPGSQEGTTKISNLNLPSDANKWMVDIVDEPIKSISKNTKLVDGLEYFKDKDIEIEKEKYIVLYAVDRNHRIKGYANIKITDEMIKQPREEAKKLEVGSIQKSKKYAGAIAIESLTDDKLPEEASKWQVMVVPTPVDKIYKEDSFETAVDYNDDIIMATEDELHSIDNHFKKYVLLLATDDEGKIKGYNLLKVGKEDISLPPVRLEPNTNYVGPIAGKIDGTTQFTKLETTGVEGAIKWQVLTSKDEINVPILNSKIKANSLDKNDNILANVGDYLLLLATDKDDKIKGYRMFKLEDGQVKWKTATKLPKGSYSTPIKGSVQGTTRIDKLDLKEVVGATQWMYKVGEELPGPVLDQVVIESMNYTAGEDIKTNIGDTLLLLATDDAGNVKAFYNFKLDNKDMIKDPPPVQLKERIHYSKPIKGDKDGTTKIEILAKTNAIDNATKWMYSVSDKEFELPEIDGIIKESKDFKAKDNIGENLKENHYLMITATDNEGKVKGYAILKLNASQIKMPIAENLPDDNYSTPEPGTIGGTTKINKLQLIGIENATEWRYLILGEEYTDTIEINTVLDRTIRYNKGSNIRANLGDYLLLLATDNRGKIKAFKQIELKEEHIRKPNAPLLRAITNYKEPEPGDKANNTKFSFLSYDNIDGATKWMYAIQDKPFGHIESNNLFNGAKEYKVNTNIEANVGDYLLLLATDDAGNVKAYKDFKLTDRNIRGGEVPELKEDINYTIKKGNMPGTTKLNDLKFYGVSGANRWKYKLMDTPLGDENKPYLNSTIDNTVFYNEGRDIDVEKKSDTEPKYGYMLILAVDNSGRTKGYGQIKINSSIVTEHAPELNVELKQGSEVDSVKFTGTLPKGTNAKYKIGNKKCPTPAKDEVLEDGIEYQLEKNITQVKIGDCIGIYAVDKNNNIKAFKSVEIIAYDIKQGSANIEDKTILEENIINGGEKIVITLTDASWAKDIKTNERKRNSIYNGLKADSEVIEWTKVVDRLIADGSGAIDIDNTKLTISLPETKDYDITKDQKITLQIPAMAIEGAINPIKATNTITIKPTIKATLSGDVVNSIVREDSIKAGGKTIIIEIQDGSWKTDVSSVIDGFEGGKNWDKIKNAIKDKGTIRRNDSKKVTITLPKVEGVDFDNEQETIKLTIPKTLIEGAETEVVASPTFTLYPNVLEIKAKACKNEDTVTLEAPDGKKPIENMNTWIIEVETGTLKDKITNKDILVSGLPRGLKTSVEKIGKNKLAIKVSGNASTKVEDMTINVTVKRTAITEPNSIDSKNVELKLKIAEELDLSNVKYKIEDQKIIFTGITPEMEYSTDSTSGINGHWNAGSNVEIPELKPIRLWVREKAQPKVFREVVNLKHGDAPKDIKIDKVTYSQNGENCTVTLSGVENVKYDYSLDGGDKWSSLSGKSIDLNSSSDLRIRKEAIPGEDGKLPSLPTNKLNSEFLGNVTMNVGEGKILGTNSNMEYSFDGTKFITAIKGETSINFSNDVEVWIRERKTPQNKRSLGKVEQQILSNLDNVEFSIKEKTINNKSERNLEYRIEKEPWKSIDKNSTVYDVDFKPGVFQLRAKGTAKKLPSFAVNKYIIKAPESAPNLTYDDVDYKINGLDDKYEYSINNGPWTNGKVKTAFEAGNIVKIRKVATGKKLPSQEQTIKFTPNENLNNVKLDVGNKKILNTTSNMEYSLDSTDGLNGTWSTCSSSNTDINIVKNSIVHVRDKAKPRHNRKVNQETIKEIDASKVQLGNIKYDILESTISIPKDQVENLQYRIGNNANWININSETTYSVGFEKGELQFRHKGDENHLPSKPVTKAVITAAKSKPDVEVGLELSSGKNYKPKNIVKSINGENSNWSNFEYSIDNSPWINGENLKNEDLNKNIKVRIRKVATKTELASQIETISFKVVLNLKQVGISTHIKPYELNGTTSQMQYCTNYDEVSPKWVNCTNGNTKLPKDIKDVWIRDKNQKENKYKVWSK